MASVAAFALRTGGVDGDDRIGAGVHDGLEAGGGGGRSFVQPGVVERHGDPLAQVGRDEHVGLGERGSTVLGRSRDDAQHDIPRSHRAQHE